MRLGPHSVELRHALCWNEPADQGVCMDSRSLVPHQPSFKLPIANLRHVFRPHDVERKLAKLPGKDHENLRTTYERMLERGPERFQVKPSGLPEMAALYEQLPNFTDALDDIKRHVALAQDCCDGLEVTPMLLLGPPGIGKTHFARKLAELLGTGMNLVPMSSMTAGWLLSGASSQGKGAKPGKVFEALIEGQRSEEHTSELQSQFHLVCRLLLEKKKRC